ncbi:hypothetical protein KO566_07365 [Flavobacteriaceae bacterium XHP0103]|nr:hypothetical protein [Marixanthotalea marina]
MSGDWYVKLLLDGQDVYGIGYYTLSTYNTTEDDGTKIWVDDHELWPTKVTPNIDISTLTFNGSDLENEYSYTTGGTEVFPVANITNGVIIKNGGRGSATGTVTDSISFNVEYSDDPGTVYQVAGYKRTGFLEDAH